MLGWDKLLIRLDYWEGFSRFNYPSFDSSVKYRIGFSIIRNVTLCYAIK
jgi:hypothetical protein